MNSNLLKSNAYTSSINLKQLLNDEFIIQYNIVESLIIHYTTCTMCQIEINTYMHMQRYRYRAKLKDACNYAVRNKYGCLCPSVSWPPCMYARVHAPALHCSSVWVPLPNRILAPLHVCSRPRACPPSQQRVGASAQAYLGPLACMLASTRLPCSSAACGRLSSPLIIIGAMEFGCACPA
jgi:hypothetical protein